MNKILDSQWDIPGPPPANIAVNTTSAPETLYKGFDLDSMGGGSLYLVEH